MLTARMAWNFPNTFDAREHQIKQEPEQSGWGNPFDIKNEVKPEFEDTKANKQLFAAELVKNPTNTLQAACNVFKDTVVALWVSRNWPTDPEVIAAKDLYLEFKELNKPILDKEQLAAKIMAEIDAKGPDGIRHLADAKDRATLLKLYAEVAGLIGKDANSNSGGTFLHNEMTIKLVRANSKEETKIIEHDEEETIEVSDVQPLPLTVKLVSSR